MMETYIRWILRRRKWILSGVLVISVLALIPIQSAVIGTSLGQLFFGDNPAFQRYQEISGKFGNDEVIVVAIEGVDGLDPQVLARLEQAEKTLLEHPEIKRVQSLASAQWVRVENGDTLMVSSFQEELNEDPSQEEAIREHLLDDPMVSGVLTSTDGGDTAIMVELAPNPNRAAEDGPEMVNSILAAIEEQGFPRESLRLAGMVAVLAEIMNQSVYSITRVLPVSSLMLLLVVFLLFGRLWPAIVSGANALLAIIWTMGFSCAIDPQITILLSVVPAVISIVSFADVIHLCSAYLLELKNHSEKEEAIVAACSDVGRACLLTSITTFLGFIGMSFVPTPAFQQLGVVLGFGTGVALLIAVTIVPIVLYYLPVPPEASENKGRGLLARGSLLVLDRLSRLPLKYPREVVFGFVITGGILIYGVSQLYVETSFKDRLSPDNPIAQDERFFKEQFSSANFLPVLISAPEEGQVLEPEFFDALVTLTEEVEAWPEVNETTSLVDLIRSIHEPFNEGDPEAPPLPTTRQALSQYLLLFEMEGGEELDRIVDFERRSVMLLVRLEEGKMRESAHIAEEMIHRGKELFPEGTELEATGQLFLTGSWLDEILDGQKQGLLFTCISITFVMAVGLRSMGIGLISMIPNLFPLLFLGGLLGLTQDQSDSDFLLIALLALSIGVDDTIHFLSRFKLEASRTSNRDEAIQKTFAFAGRGILNTTVALSLGFLPFAMSDYLATQIFGTYLPMVFVVAFLADVLLLPAMAQLGALRFEGPKQES